MKIHSFFSYSYALYSFFEHSSYFVLIIALFPQAAGPHLGAAVAGGGRDLAQAHGVLEASGGGGGVAPNVQDSQPAPPPPPQQLQQQRLPPLAERRKRMEALRPNKADPAPVHEDKQVSYRLTRHLLAKIPQRHTGK